MSDIDLLPPNVKMDSDLNLKIRVRMLAQVILDLVEECGATDCKDSIKKGIIDRAIINGLTLSYIDSKKIIRAEITFQIDWDKLELKAKANDKITIIDGLDINKFLAQQLDPRLCAELSRFVARLNEKYDIVTVESSYSYQQQFVEDKDIFYETMKYMNHCLQKSKESDLSDMNYELKVAFNGLDNYLNIIIKK